MRSFTAFALVAAAVHTVAQRPANTSICDYYTTALLKDNNATNQYTLLTLLVNTVVIGNYTKPNVGVMVPGILAQNQTYNNTPVNLLPYFNGALASTNNGGKSGVSVNFLDGGGAAPLMQNKPADSTTSAQYALLTHLYQFFGILLGCSSYSKTGFPAYGGDASMTHVHRFMDLDAYQVGWFIEQVGLAAKSFGVADSDIAVVAEALYKLFGYRCSPKAAIVPGQPAALQAICLASDCPKSTNATCSAYPKIGEPKTANGSVSVSGTAMPTSSAPATSTNKNDGAVNKVGGSLLGLVMAVFWLI